MTTCIMKESVERLRQQAIDARGSADEPQRAALDGLIQECDHALTYVTRMPTYRGGRLETGRANKAFRHAESLRAKFPDLLP